jgi:GT2 family glycosyltransferase
VDSLRVVFIFVVYREYESLDRILSSQVVPCGVTVVVVDNTEPAHADHSRLASWISHGAEVVSPGNVGYCGAAAVAVEHIPAISESDFVCLANTDLDFDIRRIVKTLREGHLSNETIGIIAPRLVDKAGGMVPQLHYRVKPSARKFRALSVIYSVYLLGTSYRLLGDLRRAARARSSFPLEPVNIFSPHGAFVIVTRHYLARTAGFSFPTFLFCEEVFFGVECERANLICRFAPEITYSHDGHGSMGRLPSRRLIRQLRDAHRLAAVELK